MSDLYLNSPLRSVHWPKESRLELLYIKRAINPRDRYKISVHTL